MQINKQELDVQFVELLPERETLFFNFQGNWSAIDLDQTNTVVGLGGDASGGNAAEISVEQGNSNE